MTISSHERYRDALTALAGDAAILSIVSEAGERRRWWTSERTWRRMYARFTPDAAAFAEIVFESEAHPQELCGIETLDAAAALARSRRHAHELASRVPCLSDLVDTMHDLLGTLHAQWPSRDRRPIHGSPHPSQWLDAGSEIGLVDFDRFGRGDPELDAGVLLADFDALDAPVVPPERLAAALLDAYRAAGVPLREPLVRAYRAHQQLARALRAAQAIRPDGDRRAEKRLAAAGRTLTEAVPV